MTEKQKAEAYVREKLQLDIIPMCPQHAIPLLKCPVRSCCASLHPIQLQHWLRVLNSFDLMDGHAPYAELYVPNSAENGTQTKILFDLTTGQPATEADYKAFNDIVGI